MRERVRGVSQKKAPNKSWGLNNEWFNRLIV